MNTGDIWPCFRQTEDDCVGHEFWAQNGDVIFDNRRGGHDGTISNSKSQVYASEHVSAEIPYFGFAHKDGKVYRKINMPSTATIILPMEICPCLQGMQWMTFF